MWIDGRRWTQMDVDGRRLEFAMLHLSIVSAASKSRSAAASTSFRPLLRPVIAVGSSCAVLPCCPAQKPRIESSDSARWSFAHFRADASRPVPAPPRSNELHHRQFPLPCCFPPSLPSSAAAQFLFTPARQCSAHPAHHHRPLAPRPSSRVAVSAPRNTSHSSTSFDPPQ
jgi:hypothetical protein